MLSAVPYDSNRVIMHMIHGIEGSDYINASWIDGYKERGAYIAAQAPTDETAADFWRAIWEHNCPIVAMLVQLTERGQEQCSAYWPPEEGVTVGNLRIEMMSEYDMKHYHLREFRLSDIYVSFLLTSPGSIYIILFFSDPRNENNPSVPIHGMARNGKTIQS